MLESFHIPDDLAIPLKYWLIYPVGTFCLLASLWVATVFSFVFAVFPAIRLPVIILAWAPFTIFQNKPPIAKAILLPLAIAIVPVCLPFAFVIWAFGFEKEDDFM